jgi:hypothetical protein
MQIRLKLTETPPITHTRPSAASSASNDPFAAILSLLEHYVSYLLALERVASRSSALEAQLPAPLFHGLGGVNLDSETQSSSLPVYRWLTVEKALVWFAMAQLRAVQAENRAARGLQLQDERALARAEHEWVFAQRLACLSAAAAGKGREIKPSIDTVSPEETIQAEDKLLKTSGVFAHALAHLCAVRQISTRLSSVSSFDGVGSI